MIAESNCSNLLTLESFSIRLILSFPLKLLEYYKAINPENQGEGGLTYKSKTFDVCTFWITLTLR